MNSYKGKVVQVSRQNSQRFAAHELEWEDEVFLSWPNECSVVLAE